MRTQHRSLTWSPFLPSPSSRRRFAALATLALLAAACGGEDEPASPFTNPETGGTGGTGVDATGGTSSETGGTDGGAVGGTTGAGGAGTGDGGSTSLGFDQTIDGGGTQSGYFTFELSLDGKNYNVQTNPWGGAEQTITAGGDAVFRVDAFQERAGGNPWDVAAFPSVYIGSAYGGNNPTVDSGLPVAIAELDSITTGLSTNSTSVRFTGNTTYDVYFTNTEVFSGGGPDVYLMVWFDSQGLNPINGADEQWNCRSQPPTYVDSCSGAGSVVIDGLTFYRFIGSNGESEVISYVPETPMDAWEFDLKDFIDDALERGVLSASMYLQSVQAGFEIVSGGVGLTVEGFYAAVR